MPQATVKPSSSMVAHDVLKTQGNTNKDDLLFLLLLGRKNGLLKTLPFL